MLLRACSPGRYREHGHPPTREKGQVGNLQSGARCEPGRTVPGLRVCLLCLLVCFLRCLRCLRCFLRRLLCLCPLFCCFALSIAKHSHRRLLLYVQSAVHIGRHGCPEGTSRTSAGLGPSTQDDPRLDARICSNAKSTARTVRTNLSAPAERGLGWGWSMDDHDARPVHSTGRGQLCLSSVSLALLHQELCRQPM